MKTNKSYRFIQYVAMILCFCGSFIAPIHARDIDTWKVQADSAYAQSDYATAITLYRQILEQGESADVYYNLAGCYYKTDEIGLAILNYERALLLNPADDDARTNLEIARAKTQDKVIPIPDVFFVAWGKSLIRSMSIHTWESIAIGSFILFLMALCLYFFSKKVVLKKIGFFVSVALFIVVIIGNYAASWQKLIRTGRDWAIVLCPSITVRSTPSEDGTSLFVVHEGLKVRVKDASMREWREVSLEDGKVGWIPADKIELI